MTIIDAHGILVRSRRAARTSRSTPRCARSSRWHFDPATGCPFWLDYAEEARLGSAARDQRLRRSRALRRCSRTTGCAAARCSAGCPRGCAGKPIYVFETGGTTGIPKTRVAFDDFRTDYELFSDTLPDKYFPKGVELADARALRARGGCGSSVEHLAQYRGGICFCVDLDPRWVIKLIKKGWSEHLEAYKAHVIDQAVTILQAGHDIRCMFTTPKLLEALALRLESMGTTIRKAGITGIFSGGTEFTPQWNRFAHEELLDGAYMTPTYGNTLMGLAASASDRAGEQLQDHLLRPAAARGHRGRRLRRSRARSSTTARPGRVKLTTLTKEFFVPGFLERDEGEREPPCEQVPVGRHQRREAVPRRRADDDGRRVLRRTRGTTQRVTTSSTRCTRQEHTTLGRPRTGWQICAGFSGA